MIIIHTNVVAINWLLEFAKNENLDVEGIIEGHYADEKIITGKIVFGKLPVGQVELCKEYWHVSWPHTKNLSMEYLDENAVMARTTVIDSNLYERMWKVLYDSFSVMKCENGFSAQCPKCKYKKWDDSYSVLMNWIINHECGKE